LTDPSSPLPPLTHTKKLHASDLRALSPSSSLAIRLQDSPSSLQLPYVRFPTPHRTNPNSSPLQELADKLAALCDAQRFLSPFPPPSGPGSKHVLWVSLPAVTESAGARKRSVAEHGAHHSYSLYTHQKKKLTGLLFWLPEARLASELEKIERDYPRHLVILAGSRRQDDPAPAPSPSAPAGGILARYQLLTPALITGLLLAFFVLVPVVLLSVSALASIQSPLRVQAPKGYSADEKKNQ
jgi:hypothetical protein